jgi:hypothetical protein
MNTTEDFGGYFTKLDKERQENEDNKKRKIVNSSSIKITQKPVNVDQRVSPKTCVEFKYAIGDTVWIKAMESEAKILSLWYAKTGIRYQCRWAADGKYNEEYLFEDEILAKKP